MSSTSSCEPLYVPRAPTHGPSLLSSDLSSACPLGLEGLGLKREVLSRDGHHALFQVSPISSGHTSAPPHHPHGLFSSIAQPLHVSDCFSPFILLSPYPIPAPTASSPISSDISVSDDLVRFHVHTQLRYDLRIISAILYINSCTSTTVPQFEYRISPHCSYQLLVCSDFLCSFDSASSTREPPLCFPRPP